MPHRASSTRSRLEAPAGYLAVSWLWRSGGGKPTCHLPALGPVAHRAYRTLAALTFTWARKRAPNRWCSSASLAGRALRRRCVAGRAALCTVLEADSARHCSSCWCRFEFKAAARKTRNLILARDETTANLPWEMFEADGGPLVQRTRMVRQFISPEFPARGAGATPRRLRDLRSEHRGYHAQFAGLAGNQGRRGRTATGRPPTSVPRRRARGHWLSAASWNAPAMR